MWIPKGKSVLFLDIWRGYNLKSNKLSAKGITDMAATEGKVLNSLFSYAILFTKYLKKYNTTERCYYAVYFLFD